MNYADNHKARHLLLNIFLVAAAAIVPASASQAQCEPQWELAVGQPGVNGRIEAMTVFEDGSGDGPALIVAGSFTTAGGAPAASIAKWNGKVWQSLDVNLKMNSVLALAVFDWDGPGIGNGPQLFASGTGAMPTLVRWDGSQWVAVPGAPTSWIGSLHVHDFGDGPELYVSGAFIFFPTIDGTTDYIARWNGTQWRATGTGLVSVTHDYASFDDGSIPGAEALFAVGGFGFFQPGQPIVIGFGRFDDRTWSGVGGGFDTGAVYALTAFDDGSGGGPALFAGGAFHAAGGTSTLSGAIAANRIARWDGTTWSTLGSGMNGDVLALEVFDEDGLGPGAPNLFAAGEFTMAGAVAANRIARWNGTAWSALNGGVNGPVNALALAPDGSGLFAGGEFTQADGQSAGNIARWECTQSMPGDINGDGVVDGIDLGILLANWSIPPGSPSCGGGHRGDPCAADLNGDGAVDGLDLGILLFHWTI